MIQASSEHPLANAILAYARHFHFFDDSSADTGTENDAKTGWLFDVSDFSALPGKGVQCFIDGKLILVCPFTIMVVLISTNWNLLLVFQRVLTMAICPQQVGNRKLMAENGIHISTEVENFVVELEESAKTGILVAYNDILTGVLGIADPLKREASVVIEGLQKMGVTPVMVTGDNWRTARAVAKEVCIFLYYVLFIFTIKICVLTSYNY